MQLKINILKNTKFLTLLLLLASVVIYGQDRIKIDGVAVVVGKNIVLDSDVANFQKEVENRSEGKVKVSDCEMLENLMQQKLLAHHAVIDSVTVTQSQVDEKVNRSIAYLQKEYGDEAKMLKAYNYSNIQEMRKELERVQKENLLIAKEQQKVTDKVDITPEEVRVYYNGLKEKDDLPKIPAEIQLAQIVLYAEPTKEEEERIINKLKAIKKEIEEGASFKLKALLNSSDISVGQNNGRLGEMTKETNYVKEFKEVAFSLDEGEISDPFKTQFGYHIIKLNKIKGKARDVSHILMQPEISDAKLAETKEEVEKLRKEILDGTISFEEAAKKYSEDKDTKNNGGVIVNPYTGESVFELTRMDPAMYARVNELKEGDLTEPFYDETRGGEKMYKVILMKKRTDDHKADLSKDYVKIQAYALQKKKEEEIAKWSKEKIKDTYIKLNSSYKKCVFKKNWKKENQ